MNTLVANDRFLGDQTKPAAVRTKKFYESFCHEGIHITHAVTAQMTKLAENSFRDGNMPSANELSIISQRFGVDAFELANSPPGINVLPLGLGVGRHCMAVDQWNCVSSRAEQVHLIRTACEVNDSKPESVWAQTASHVVLPQELRLIRESRVGSNTHRAGGGEREV